MTQVTIELDKHIAEQWNNLVRLLGDQNLLFSDFIDYHKKNIQREIARMQIDLSSYEDKYKMSSDVFYDKFERGELEDSNDFIYGPASMKCNRKARKS